MTAFEEDESYFKKWKKTYEQKLKEIVPNVCIYFSKYISTFDDTEYLYAHIYFTINDTKYELRHDFNPSISTELFEIEADKFLRKIYVIFQEVITKFEISDEEV